MRLFRIAALVLVGFLLVDPYRSEHYGLILVAVALWGLNRDQLNVSWRRFLPLGLPLLVVPFLLGQFFPAVWAMVVDWELNVWRQPFNWNEWFASIPGNDGWMFRVFQTPWLTEFMRWIYAYGFTLPILVPILRSFLAKDARKMLRYVLSAQVLQVFLFLPFYLTIHLDEVWYVLGHPDGMARNLTAVEAPATVLNCFPSMHTSLAVAMMLVAWREKDALFRWVWFVYGILIIYSTMYLEIHWVLDVAAGIFMGWLTVRLADRIIKYLESKWGLAKESEGFTDDTFAA